MRTSLLERLHRLAAVWGPAGREQKIAGVLQEMLAPLVDEIRTDRFGNLIAIKRGALGGKRVMLAAHMDTIGALALNVSDTGLIYVAPVGDFQAHHAIGHKVVWGNGVVGVLQHETVSDPKDLDMKRLWCDIGATSREEALENVRLGEMCVLTGELQQMGDAIVGPSLDNRAGCAVLVEVAEHLGQVNHEVVFTFTAQGEIGPRGAGTAAYGVDPDVAFAMDLGSATDLPKSHRPEVKVGGGPALKIKDGAYMAHGPLSDLVRAVAELESIPLQTEIVRSPGGHNDAQVVSVSGQGVPTAVIDVPCRYGGTAGELVSIRDLYGAADLLLKLLRDPLAF